MTFFFALKGQFTPKIELTDFSLFIHQDNSSTSWSDWGKISCRNVFAFRVLESCCLEFLKIHFKIQIFLFYYGHLAPFYLRL